MILCLFEIFIQKNIKNNSLLYIITRNENNNMNLVFNQQGSHKILRKQFLKIEQKILPAVLFVKYQQSSLKLQFDFKSLPFQQYTSSRHILIVQTNTFSNQQIFQLIQIFHNKLKLGDFLKVIYVGKQPKNHWFEKSADRLEKQEFYSNRLKNVPLIELIEYAIKNVGKYNETVLVSIVTNDMNSMTGDTLNKIQKIRESYSKRIIFNFIYACTQLKQLKHKKLLESLDFKLYPFIKITFSKDIDQYFINLSKIRVKQASIKLKCLDRQIDFTHILSLGTWKLDEVGAITKTYYNVTNEFTYIDTFNLRFYYGNITFYVEFMITLMDNLSYKMSKEFSIQFKPDGDEQNNEISNNEYSNDKRNSILAQSSYQTNIKNCNV